MGAQKIFRLKSFADAQEIKFSRPPAVWCVREGENKTEQHCADTEKNRCKMYLSFRLETQIDKHNNCGGAAGTGTAFSLSMRGGKKATISFGV